MNSVIEKTEILWIYIRAIFKLLFFEYDKIMIKTILLISACTIATGISQCLAQLSDSQTITNYGQSVQGVQMGITTTNDTFRVGSSAVVQSVIKNSSTNVITVLETIYGEYADAVLISETGKLYHVTTKSNAFGYRFTLRPIQTGEQKVEPIYLTFGEDIEEGDYKLKAIRKFSMDGKDFTLESNSIKITITR